MPMALTSEKLLSSWLPRIAEIALVLLLAWLLAGWLTAMPAPSPRPTERQATVNRPEINRIATVPLFGRQAEKPLHSPTPLAAAPTRLNIRLLGTVVAGSRSSAVIRLNGDVEKVVFLGQPIQPGLTLVQVDADSIIVDNRGRREKVLLTKDAWKVMPAGGSVASERRRISRAEIQKQLQDLPKLLTGALIVPHQAGGTTDGFAVQQIVPDSIYGKAGLQNGDVIRKVNGIPVTTPEQGVALYEQLKDAPSIDLEISRSGSIRHLHYDIR